MKKLTVIWDVTRYCPWDCKICCMGASDNQCCMEKELNMEQKRKVAEQLEELKRTGVNIRVDLSGGEIMMNRSHMELIKMVSEALGKDAVGISTSGIGIGDAEAAFFAKYVHDVELTMDLVPGEEYLFRKKGYHATAAKAVDTLKRAGVSVGIQTVICRKNCQRESMSSLLDWLCEHQVDQWSILRFFASGRGEVYRELEMTAEENLQAVHMIKDLCDDREGNKPDLDFHYLMPGHEKSSDVCRCVRKSIGILPNGNVTACFWALDREMVIKDEKFYLGNVLETSLSEILRGKKAAYWLCRDHKCELSCA